MKKIVFLFLLSLIVVNAFAYLNRGGSTTQVVGYWEITRGGVSISDAPASDFEFIAVLVGLADTVNQDGLGCSVEDLEGLLAVKIDYQCFYTTVTSRHTILIQVRQKSTGIVSRKYIYPPLDLGSPQNWGLDGIDLYGGIRFSLRSEISWPYEENMFKGMNADRIIAIMNTKKGFV